MFSGLDMQFNSELQNGACSEVNIGQLYHTMRLVALHMEHNPNVFFNHGLIDLGHKYHGDQT